MRRFDPRTGEVTTAGDRAARAVGAVLVPGRLDRTGPTCSSSSRPRTGSPGCGCPKDAVRVDRRRATAPGAPSLDVAPGEVELVVVFEPPPGQKLDDRYGPSTRLLVSASPPELLRRGDGQRSAS